MPSAVEYKPSDRALLEKGDKERSDRQGAIKEFFAYYDGAHEPQLRPRPGTRDDNVIMNLTTGIIDRAVAFMLPEMPRVLVQEDSQAYGFDIVPSIESASVDVQESDEQRSIDMFWGANDGEIFLVDAATMGFVTGHVFIKILEPDDTVTPPRLALLDTDKVTIFWDESDRNKVLWYEIHWTTDGPTRWRQDIVPKGNVNVGIRGTDAEYWEITDYVMRPNSGRWVVVGADIWDYQFSPIVEWKNWPNPRARYGKSDLHHAKLNDVLNFVLSNTVKIIRYHASPQTVVVGAKEPEKKEDQQTGPDTMIYLPDGSVVRNLEMQSDLASSMQMINMLRGALYSEASVVDTETHKDKIGQMTNFGLRMMYADMLDRTRLKRELYGRGISEMTRRSLAVWDGTEIATPSVYWKDPLPVSEIEVAEVQLVDKELGIKSKRTMAEERGLDWEAEKERIDDEKQESDMNMSDAIVEMQTRTGF